MADMDNPAAGPAQRPTQVRWLIFGLACAASWLLYLHRYSWGVIKTTFSDQHPEISKTELGWLDSAFMGAYTVGQVPAGLAGDYFGAGLVLTISILLWSAWVPGVAWTRNFTGLFGIRSALGLAQAGAYPAMSKMTRNWFPLSIRTRVQGVVAAFGRIGAACAAPIIGTLLMGLLGFSWQTSLLVIAAPGVLLAILFGLMVRDHPRQHPWCNAAESAEIEAGSGGATTAKRGTLLLNRGSLFSLGMLLAYAFFSTFQGQLYVNWIPMFLEKGRGLDKETTGMFTPFPFIGAAAGGIFAGWLNDYLLRRMRSRRWARSSIAFTGKFVAAGLVLASLQVADGRAAMVVLLAARFFGDWSLPTQWGTITEMSGRASATVFGLVNSVGAIGGFVAGPLLGSLLQHFDWEGLFVGVAVMCALSAVCWLFIDCTRRLVAD
jgi:sugar phosphate permease